MAYALNVHARITATDPTITDSTVVVLDGLGGLQPQFNAGTSPLGNTLQDNLTYEIGTDLLNRPLRDGATMVIPKNVTVMVDAGAIIRLNKANITVGSSSVGVDHSGASLQILGTPGDSVYITSYQDKSIGKLDNPYNTAVGAGDWGGLVFENDVDRAYNAGVVGANGYRADPEQAGIFLDFINHADIMYGGGKVSVNSVTSVYDPIHLIDARVTADYNSISHSADAAISADPNAFQETIFEGSDANSSTPIYTAGYSRIGPDLHTNHIAANSLNGLLVRIRTNAGSPLDTLTVSARFAAHDIVYIIPQNLEIAGNPGGPLLTTSTNTTHLLKAGTNAITAVTGSSIVDGETFTVAAGAATTTFEMDSVSLSVLSGLSFAAGDSLVITDPDDPALVHTFTFDSTGTVPGAIEFKSGDNPDTIAQDVVSAINAYYGTTGIAATGTPLRQRRRLSHANARHHRPERLQFDHELCLPFDRGRHGACRSSAPGRYGPQRRHPLHLGRLRHAYRRPHHQRHQ